MASAETPVGSSALAVTASRPATEMSACCRYRALESRLLSKEHRGARRRTETIARVSASDLGWFRRLMAQGSRLMDDSMFAGIGVRLGAKDDSAWGFAESRVYPT